jgi:hypothetical protein
MQKENESPGPGAIRARASSDSIPSAGSGNEHGIAIQKIPAAIHHKLPLSSTAIAFPA